MAPPPASVLSSKPLEYEPLKPNEIRLIQSEYDESTGELSCHFKVVDINHLPVSYNIISACWDGPTRDFRINFPKSQYTMISAPVKDVLIWAARYRNVSYYWIDYLCINQFDSKEWAEHVSIISRVFSRSRDVIIWLGNIDGGGAAADFILKLSADVGALLREQHYATPEDLKQIWRSKTYRADFAVLKTFLHHLWFRQIWSVQDVVMAREVQKWERNDSVLVAFNGNFIYWAHFVLAVKSFDHGMDDTTIFDGDPYASAVSQNILTIDRLREARLSNKTLNLADGLLECSRFVACNPRDAIYAVASICEEVESERLRADYVCSTEEVFARAAFTLLVDKQLFGILNAAGVGLCGGNKRILPSWAPDWSNQNGTLTGLRVRRHESHNASRTRRPQVKGDWSARTVTFKGILIDSHDCSFDFPNLHNPPSDRKWQSVGGRVVWPWMDEIRSFLRRSPHFGSCSTEARDLIIIRSLTGDAFNYVYRDKNTAFRDDSKQLQALALWLENNDKPSDLWRERLSSTKRTLLETFEQGLGSQVWSKLFGTQEHGLLGLGPHGVEEGDKLCVLYGCKRLCLLRPSEYKENQVVTWKFVGECFIDGLMHGEGLRLGKEQDFTII